MQAIIMATLEREKAAEARAARAAGDAGAHQHTRRSAGTGGGAAPPSVRLLHSNVRQHMGSVP